MVEGHYINGDIHHLFFFALHCFATILSSWCKICPNKVNCRHLPFSTKSPIMQKVLLLSNFHGTRWWSLLPSPVYRPHVSILAKLEGLKVELHRAKNQIIDGVKEDLNGRCLGSQSYFDKEEIIAKMNERHNELLHKVEVVGRRSSTAR